MHAVSMSDLDSAIFSTLCYAQVFGAAIAPAQLHAWLHTSKRWSKEMVFRRLQSLIVRGLIVGDRDLVAFRTQDIAASKKNNRWSDQKLEMVRRNIWRISWIPSVRGVALTGSVAIQHAHRNDDIDFFIVTSPGMLWMTRLLVVMILWGSGLLRYGSMRHTNNRWCLNLWLTSQNLGVTQHSLYLAREIVQARWVLDKEGISRRFLRENRWIRAYLAHVVIPNIEGRVGTTWRWVTWLDMVAYFLQRWYMHSRMTREVVRRDAAFFHPRDTSGQIMRQYTTLVASYVARLSSLPQTSPSLRSSRSARGDRSSKRGTR